MMSTEAGFHLELDAEPDSIGVARRAVAEMASGLGMREPALDDLRTVVSEACSNVVLHAYPAEVGMFEIDAYPVGADLQVVVRDFGEGLRAQTKLDSSSLRLGLGLISMLTSHFEISGTNGSGTEIRMLLPLL